MLPIKTFSDHDDKVFNMFKTVADSQLFAQVFGMNRIIVQSGKQWDQDQNQVDDVITMISDPRKP